MPPRLSNHQQHLLDLLGKRVRARREKLGLSQERLAEQAGLHRTFVGAVERAEVNTSVVNLVKIADGLGVDVGTLARGLSLL